MSRIPYWLAVVAGVIALPGVASAQVYVGGQVGGQVGGSVQVGGGVQAGYAQPQPVYAQPQPVYVQQQPQPVYVQQQPVQQQPVYVQRPVRVGRLRYGADLGAGWMFAGGTSGFSLTGSLRLGWQVNDNLAVYYQGVLPIGFAAGNVGGVDYAGAAIVLGNGLMGEWHFNDLFSVALGPSLDYALGGVCRSGSDSDCIGGAGAYFGIQARLSLSLVSASAGQDTRRYGFRFGVSSHTSFIGGYAFQFVDLHLGYEWF